MDGELLEALEGTRTAFGVLDRGGRYRFANRALAELLETSADTLRGARYGAREGEAFDAAFRAAIHDGGTRSARIELTSGHTADVELSAAGECVVAIFRERDVQLDVERTKHDVAEQERAMWERLLEDLPAQVSIIEAPDLRYRFVNAAWRAQFGDREPIGKRAIEVFPEYQGTPIHRALEQAHHEGRSVVVTEQPVTLRHAPHDARFMTFLLQPLRDAGGVVVGVMVASFDVTEPTLWRMRLERVIAERDRLVADLEAQQSRLSKMFKRSLVGTITWNLDGRILDANDAFLQTIGYTRDDLESGAINWQRLTPPEYRDVDAAQVRALLEEGMHPHFEKEYVRKDGTRVPVLISAAFFEGSRREGLSYIVDLSGVKRAEAAVRASEQRFRSLIEATSQTVWTTEPTGAVTEPSPSWTAFTGQGEDERKGFGWLEAVHPDDRERTRAEWLAAIAGRSVCDLEYRLRRRDGSYAITSFKAVPIRDDKGNVREWVGANTDVTAQRTAALERERLLVAAQAASRAKDELLGTLSHELRTPLNAILGWTSLLRGGVIAPEQRARALDVIERNARAQAHVVEDLLDLSRIARETLVVDRVPLELGRLVRAELEAERPALDAKRVRLVTRLDSSARVLGDADRLQQIVANLVSNALKFTLPGGRISVSVEPRGASVALVVSDDGRGIAPEFLPYVFEPFRQADSSTTRPTGGLGLGLAIVRTLVDLHGGAITAESDGLGHGATFTVALPRLPGEHDARSAQAASGS